LKLIFIISISSSSSAEFMILSFLLFFLDTILVNYFYFPLAPDCPLVSVLFPNFEEQLSMKESVSSLSRL
jgi:hypothetical protein